MAQGLLGCSLLVCWSGLLKCGHGHGQVHLVFHLHLWYNNMVCLQIGTWLGLGKLCSKKTTFIYAQKIMQLLGLGGLCSFF